MSLINLTPHAVCVEIDGQLVTIKQGGRPARLKMAHTVAPCLEYDGHQVPFTESVTTDVVNLPDPTPGTYFIVSRMVATTLRGQRDDLLVVEGLILDANRNVRGCRTLLRLA